MVVKGFHATTGRMFHQCQGKIMDVPSRPRCNAHLMVARVGDVCSVHVVTPDEQARLIARHDHLTRTPASDGGSPRESPATP